MRQLIFCDFNDENEDRCRLTPCLYLFYPSTEKKLLILFPSIDRCKPLINLMQGLCSPVSTTKDLKYTPSVLK